MADDIVKVAGAALAGGLLVLLLLARGFSIRPTKVSLPFLDMDISRFGALSPVRLFNAISMAALPVASADVHAAAVAADATPVVMIHAGWNVVCEAFVRRFQAYPNDERIEAAAAQIGGQNVEFVKMYRDIHTNAIRNADAVGRDFAAHYLARAPSLAERVEGQPPETDGLTRGLLGIATNTIQGG